MKRSFMWRLNHVVHNCVAHPLLPFAEVLDSMNLRVMADIIFAFHDITSPDADDRNNVRYLS